MRILLLLVLPAAFVACDSATDDEPDTGGATATDGTDGSDSSDVPDGTDGVEGTDSTSGKDVVAPGKVCVPGTVKGCSADQQAAVVCNDAGDGYESRKCKDDRGQNSLCEEELGCRPCFPLKTRCKDDDTVEICETGAEWIVKESCSAIGTSQVCYGGATSGTCLELCEGAKKLNSYMGCEYWGADLDNAFVPGGPRSYYDAAGAQFAIVVSNTSAKKDATVTIYDSDGEVLYDSKQQLLDKTPIPPGGLRVYNLPRRDVDGTTHAPLAYQVKSTIPVSAYQFNPLANVGVFSNDASILLPENVLDRWYIVMTREQTFEILRSFLTVIGTSPNPTEVTVTVTAPTLENKPQGIPALKPGDTIKRTLNQYDVLNIETNRPGSDLTGSVVLSSNRVAVFGGSEAANAPNTAACTVAKGAETGVCAWDGETECETPLDCLEFNTCCADHLEMAMFPVRTWGQRYICAQTYRRGKAKDVWRILAASDNTVITTVPPQANIPVLNSGEYFEFESDKDFEIVSKKPVLVGQFLAAQDAPDPNVGGNAQADDAKIGDPAFMLAVPFEQYRVDYIFLTPPLYAFNYVTATVPTGYEVMVDGVAVGPEEMAPVGTGEFSSFSKFLPEGTHSMSCDAPFGIMVYGWDDYVSYGYPGGLDLNDLKYVKPPDEK